MPTVFDYANRFNLETWSITSATF